MKRLVILIFTLINLVNLCAKGLKYETSMSTSTFQESLIKEETTYMKSQALRNYPIAGGISAPFVGIHKNRLIVMGGCNFREKDGNQVRTFYNDIYSIELTDKPENNDWIKHQSFPTQIAYGASVNTPEGIICIGGNTDNGTTKVVYLAYYNDTKNEIETKAYPSLPFAISNASASLIDRTVYVAGGMINGEVKNAVFALNLDSLDKGWKQIETPTEAERQQPVVFAQNNQLFMAGGYDEVNAKVFTDIVCFDFEKEQWIPFSQIDFDGNNPQTMIGGSAVTSANCEVLFVSGVNYDRFQTALLRIRKTQEAEKNKDSELWVQLKEKGKEYMSQEVDWYKFRTQLLKLNTAAKQWESIGYFSELARAGAAIALHNNKLYIVGGELKPGVRTETANYIELK